MITKSILGGNIISELKRILPTLAIFTTWFMKVHKQLLQNSIHFVLFSIKLRLHKLNAYLVRRPLFVNYSDKKDSQVFFRSFKIFLQTLKLWQHCHNYWKYKPQKRWNNLNILFKMLQAFKLTAY